ncbi:hypothetical protein [Kytococcus sedentarius]|uniref:hypothetical protein n=1 Tax=Kytococcus sedentarius TaxID=1276 RepID=UPI0019522B38|nr:hypothetical protein [Kytococcus sedentarius]QRO87140.1 hypothetical protein I6J30_10005 [Kytococcus sedentarius]
MTVCLAMGVTACSGDSEGDQSSSPASSSNASGENSSEGGSPTSEDEGLGAPSSSDGASAEPSESGDASAEPSESSESGDASAEPSESGESGDASAEPSESGEPGDASGESGDPSGDDQGQGKDKGTDGAWAKKVPAGEAPPQFVVISWDGSGETPLEQGVSRFRTAGDESDATMTFFLSGPFLATGPEVKEIYDPPNHPKGMQHIKPRTKQMVIDTTRELAAALETGHEVGTHYNGHFCGPKGGGDWSVKQWHQEMDEWYEFVERWEGKTPIEGGTALPKGLARSVEGGRTPCLEGVENAQKAAAEDGWTYDSSSLDIVRWPEKAHGIWNIPMPSVHIKGMEERIVPAMDYNWFAAFNTWAPDMPNDERGRVMQETYDRELEKALKGNRAPLILGNHLAAWDDGTYLDAMERFTREQCVREEVNCVSFKELVDFLDAQDPETLAAWREVPPGGKGQW